jgi:hypothetical protein
VAGIEDVGALALHDIQDENATLIGGEINIVCAWVPNAGKRQFLTEVIAPPALAVSDIDFKDSACPRCNQDSVANKQRRSKTGFGHNLTPTKRTIVTVNGKQAPGFGRSD